MRCANCGAERPNETAACPACGAAASMQQQAVMPAPETAAQPVRPLAAAEAVPPPQDAAGQTPAAVESAPQEPSAGAGAETPAETVALQQPVANQPPPQAPAPMAQPHAGGWQQPQAPMAPGATPRYAPPPYGAPPAYAAAGIMPQPKKKKKTMVIALVAVLVLALLGTALAVYFIAFGGNAKKTVRDAFANTLEAMRQERQEISDRLGFAAAMEGLSSGPVEMDYELWLDVPDIGGELTIGGSAHSDVAARRMEMSMALGFAGARLLEVDIGVDDDLVALEAPKLFSGSYGVYASTMARDLGGTPLDDAFGGAFGFAESFDIWPEETAEADDGGEGALYTAATGEELDRLFNTMWESATVEKTGSRQESVNGFEMNCDVYMVEMESRPLVNYILNAAGTLLDDAQLRALLQQLYLTRGGAYYTEDDFDVEVEYILDDLAYALEDIFEGGAYATVYVHGGKMVKLDVELKAAGGEVGLYIDFGSDTRIGDCLGILVREESDTRFALEMTGNVVDESGVYNLEAVFFDGNSATTLALYYDTASSADNFELTFSVDAEELIIEAAGMVTCDTAASEIYLDLYDIYLSESGDAFTAALEYEIRPGSGHFATLSPTMLADLSDAEMEELMDELQYNIMSLAYALY